MTLAEKKKYLNSYYYLVKDCARYDLKLLELRTEIENTKKISYSDMPKGSNRKTLEDFICEIIEIEKELNKKRLEAHKKYLEIDTLLNSIENPNERIILKLRYLERKHWEDIAKEMNYTDRHIRRLFNYALKKLRIDMSMS